MPGKTKYNTSWESTYDWIKSSTKSENHAFCKICSRDISIAAGSTQLDQHQTKVIHLKNKTTWKNQSKFSFQSGSVQLTSSKSTNQLIAEDEVLHAEVVRCLDIVDSNLPFAVADTDAAKYAKMFPSCREIKSYQQKSNKVRYTIQFGIAPYIKELILTELRGLPFTFKFDESTSSQTKKQYDGYATYDSPHFGRIITTYLGTLFVGKCTADDLLKHMKELMGKSRLEIEAILSLGMDGPNVNLLFKKKLEKELKCKCKNIIDTGTCPLHIASNAFLEGLKALQSEAGIDFDQFVLDLFGFFKYSAKRVQDYLDVREFTELQSRRMMKHVTTRWISLHDVLIRVMEQLPNLKEYFLKELPKEKGFNYKSGVGNQERYIRIKNALQNKKLPAVAYAVIYVSKAFKDFLVSLQTTRPMITILYDKMINLIKNCMQKFLLEESSTSNGTMKSLKKLKCLDLASSKIQMVSRPYKRVPFSILLLHLIITY